MQKTANQILFMIIFLFLNLRFIDSPSSSTMESLESKVKVYEKFMEYREMARRITVEDQMYDSLMQKSSIKWLLTGFVKTQIHIESRGNQNAISPEGAVGIAQFMPDTWSRLIQRQMIPEWFSINNEKHQRIAQLIYLDHLYGMWWQFPEDRRALTAASYNAGPGRILSIIKIHGLSWRDHLPSETINYLKHLKIYVNYDNSNSIQNGSGFRSGS